KSRNEIESFNNQKIIIADSYDKNINYKCYIKVFKKNGKTMVLMGATKYKLKNLCEKYDIEYVLVEDMTQAIKTAYNKSKAGDVVLLSPASASWDMYKSYEIRGNEFKDIVMRLEEK